MTELDTSIRAFNELYRLPAPVAPTMPGTRAELIDKLGKFRDILHEELTEVDAIISGVIDGLPTQTDTLTDIADWLGDIMVYCASEMTKYGLEPSAVLGIIMSSNMSKLGEDGNPIYDERGKVMKGPNYWKPEPMIHRYITAAARQALKESTVNPTTGD